MRCQTFKSLVRSFSGQVKWLRRSFSWVEWNKGFQAIAAAVADYSKKSFVDGTRAWEQLVKIRLEQAWEIQSQYVKKAFDAYVPHPSKISEMHTELAHNAYRPVEKAAYKVRNPA